LAKTNHIVGQPYTAYLTVKTDRPVDLVIKGYEKHKPLTVYFERKYGYSGMTNRFVGTKTFEIPLAIEPDNLQIQLYNAITGKSNGISVVNITTGKLKSNPITQPEIREFLDFAKWFSKNVKYLKLGRYYSAKKRFYIDYMDKVRYEPNLPPVKTIASVNHETGRIIVGKDEVFGKNITVSNMFMTLCHEFIHYWYNTDVEKQADIYGAELYLKEGFSKTEALYTLYNLFKYAEYGGTTFNPIKIGGFQTRVKDMYEYLLNK